MILHGRILIALAIIFGVSGCAKDRHGQASPSDYVTDASARVAAADWPRAKAVTVTLSDFRFTPATIEFRQNAPYRLRLVNRSGSSHTFTSPGFFRAIAIQKLQVGAADLAAASLQEIEVAPGGEKDLYFVAARPGVYELHCAEFLHDTLGMTGQVTIQ